MNAHHGLPVSLGTHEAAGRFAGEAPGPADRVFVPLRIMSGGRELRFLNMVATLGTALDVTAAELVIEVLYPADSVTFRAIEGEERARRFAG